MNECQPSLQFVPGPVDWITGVECAYWQLPATLDAAKRAGFSCVRLAVLPHGYHVRIPARHRRYEYEPRQPIPYGP